MFLAPSVFFFSSRRRHTRYIGDWSSDVCSSDLPDPVGPVTRTSPLARRVKFRTARGRSSSSKIGRASCRERVESPGGAGNFKKKQHEVRKVGEEERGREGHEDTEVRETQNGQTE